VGNVLEALDRDALQGEAAAHTAQGARDLEPEGLGLGQRDVQERGCLLVVAGAAAAEEDPGDLPASMHQGLDIAEAFDQGQALTLGNPQGLIEGAAGEVDVGQAGQRRSALAEVAGAAERG